VDRVQRWTYNAIGQKLSAESPDTGTTVWGYHADETADHRSTDLATETTSDGRVTRYMRYDRVGRLLESVDPNGIATQHSYDLRGRLLSHSVGSRVTRYTYDPVGQLTRLTLPDGSWVGWDYDDAHRKIAVYDDQGHRIDYLLDKASNKVGENVQDPGGGLRRTLRNIVDALGRVERGEGREVAP
jgi:YD repeat-containing protein